MTQLPAAALRRLDDFGTLVVTGPDARSYLQGQLSFDLDRLTPGQIELATCNSPQGRVQAVTWILERSDAIVLLLPAALVDRTLARLKKYVLRAKVKVESGAARFGVFGATEAPSIGTPRAHTEIEGRSYVQWPGGSPRVLCIAEPNLDARTDADFVSAWHRADIEAGLPQVYPQTLEAFVAQMLNVDALGGIGFEKGCYTGQEIIARTHYRGAVKRRMFRFRADSAPPEPGTRIVANDQHAGDVVDAVATSSGCELLAVVALAQAEAELEIDSTRAKLERLGIPYSVE
jgi:folate-binding protein YgfZ